VDSYGTGCEYYVEFGCTGAEAWGRDGVDAYEACCVCGGGTCDDKDDDWTDYYGDGCDWYMYNNADNYACNGAIGWAPPGDTALENCCVCGGGDL